MEQRAGPAAEEARSTTAASSPKQIWERGKEVFIESVHRLASLPTGEDGEEDLPRGGGATLLPEHDARLGGVARVPDWSASRDARVEKSSSRLKTRMERESALYDALSVGLVSMEAALDAWEAAADGAAPALSDVRKELYACQLIGESLASATLAQLETYACVLKLEIFATDSD